MAEGSSKPREIDLGDDFGDVFVRANGMNVQIHADGRVETYPKIITKPGPANDTAAKATHEIGTAESAGDDFGTAVVEGGGITVELSDNGDVTVHTNGSVKLRPAANDHAKPSATTGPEIGDEMEEGTIYAGISPDTHEPIYARPKDESGTYTFNEAAKHAKNIGDGFHVPTKNELNVLYENRNKGKLAGTFNVTGSDPAGWYWSSTPSNYCYAWAQRFSDGYQHNIDYRTNDSSLRLVR